MANALRGSVRRFATTAVRAATAETVNAYGIRVSKAQGVVDTLVGGRLPPPKISSPARTC